MASESIIHSAFGLMSYWLRGLEEYLLNSFNDVSVTLVDFVEDYRLYQLLPYKLGT